MVYGYREYGKGDYNQEHCSKLVEFRPMQEFSVNYGGSEYIA